MAGRDLDRAFPETPAAFSEAIFRGFAEGRRREKRRRVIISSACAAAVLALALLGMWQGMNLGEDRVASPSGNAIQTSEISRVYTSADDPCYHRDAQCAGGVEMSLEAARAFRKAACPKCFSEDGVDK